GRLPAFDERTARTQRFRTALSAWAQRARLPVAGSGPCDGTRAQGRAGRREVVSPAARVLAGSCRSCAGGAVDRMKRIAQVSPGHVGVRNERTAGLTLGKEAVPGYRSPCGARTT